MIIKRRRKAYFSPPDKKKLSVHAIILYVLLGILLFALGFFAAHPVAELLRVVF